MRFGPLSGPPALVALFTHLVQARGDGLYPRPQQAAIGLQLGFSRTAQADTALLALQVGPAPHQPCAHVLQLCQFHLQLALVGAGALGEDIQNQAGAIQHPAFELLLEVAFLARTERVVEHDNLGFVPPDLLPDLLEFAAADKRPGMGSVPLPHHIRSRIPSCGQDELLEFPGIFPFGFTGKIQVDEHSPFARIGAIKEQYYLSGRGGKSRRAASATLPSSRLTAAVILFRRILHRQPYHTRGYHGRDGVLVHHLADGVLQQHHELVEGLNLALQLDSIDQVNGDRYAFLTQNVQVRVL
jgi:hypothetical protein